MKTDVLNQIGLNDSEIKVYFALLELDSSSVGPIIEKSKVQDSKIYSILEKLKEKGLVSFVIKNNVKHFQASDPKNIIRILDRKKLDIENQKKEIKQNILPLIEKRRKLKEDKQEATVYEGFEGIRSAFNLILDNLQKGEEYQVFMLGDEIGDKKVMRFFQNYHSKRVEKGIDVRLIGHLEKETVMNKFYKFNGMKIKYTKQKYPVGIFIFKGYVMTLIWEEKPTAFVIKSQKNYNQYKEYFEDLWKIARK